jgi:hypothetical protein
MAHIGETLSLDTLPQPDNFEPLPAGNYVVEVIESDVVDTKTGLGRQMKLTLKVVDGELEGRRVWANIMVRHQNEMAQRIGQQVIASLISAAGIGPIDDTEELHGIPVIAKVAIETDKTGQYEPRNVVKGFLAYGTPTPKPVAQTKAAPPAKAQGAQPWLRK